MWTEFICQMWQKGNHAESGAVGGLLTNIRAPDQVDQSGFTFRQHILAHPHVLAHPLAGPPVNSAFNAFSPSLNVGGSTSLKRQTGITKTYKSTNFID